MQLTESGHIRVNRVARTSMPSIYAAGDCTDFLPLASVASMQGRTAVFHAMGDAVNPTELRNVTSNIFTQPEIATVGWSQKQIEEGVAQGDVYKLPLASNPRAKMMGIKDGFVKLFASHAARAPSSAASSWRRRPPSSSCRSRSRSSTASRSTSSPRRSRSTRRSPARSRMPRGRCTSSAETTRRCGGSAQRLGGVMNLRVKSVEASIADSVDEERSLKRSLGTWDLALMGIAVAVGAGHLLGRREGGGRLRRAERDHLVHPRRAHVRARDHVLRRVRVHRAGGRQRLHLHVRDHGRAPRVDHRLGPHPRDVHGRRGDREVLGRLPRRGAPRRRASPFPATFDVAGWR